MSNWAIEVEKDIEGKDMKGWVSSAIPHRDQCCLKYFPKVFQLQITKYILKMYFNYFW